MTNTVLYLIGPPGVGKYTVAQELAARTGARIVDNHSINNPIFNLVDMAGEPLSAGVWQRVAQVRRAVLETAAHLSPPDWSFIFTNALDDRTESHLAYYGVLGVAEARGARFVPVGLRCETEELLKRIVRPERAKRMKDTNPETARLADASKAYPLNHPNALTLEVTRLSAAQAAEAILEHLTRLPEAV